MSDKERSLRDGIGAEDDAEASAADNPDSAGIVQNRRQFLIGMGKWSRAVVTGAVLGSGALLTEKPAQAGWLNRRGCCVGGGSWVNGRGGGWVNRRGGGYGGSWINRR